MESISLGHLKIKDGKMSLSFFSDKKFIGSTVGGEYPPVESFYDEFSCKPKQGQPGILAFEDSNSHETGFLQFRWEGDKLVVGPKVECLAHYCFSRSTEYGLVVQVGRLSYVTKLPSNLNLPVSGQKRGRLFKKVDLIDILKYINGQYGLKELDKSVCACVRTKEIEAALRNLEKMIKEEQALLDAARSEIFNSQILLGDILDRCWWLGAHLRKRVESRINSLIQMVKELGESYSRWGGGYTF